MEMLAKLTSKNQITIPKNVLSKLQKVKYFEVELTEGKIILKPVKIVDTDLEGIRTKVKKLGLSQECVSEAVRWARSK
jgi:bifunctional DNA-binding transcriptional regulator/antitoxin component of YhaV-PrlF toxin-antitoxin module